jgi:hypothetical protein
VTDSAGATAWAESYLGGSPEREEELIRSFAEQIHKVQRRNRKQGGEPILRAFHAKLLAGIGDARVEISRNLRPELRTAMLDPGATYPTVVRFSSASGMIQPDDADDLRGIAVRILLDQGEPQDLLMTNAPASHARDARQFMVTSLAMAGGRRLGAIPRLALALGPWEALRILRALRRASSRHVQSLATETFWSRAPFVIGPYAVKLILRPEAHPGAGPGTRGRDRLRAEFVERLRRDDVRYLLQVQRFVDGRRTPIEDGTVEWTEADAPPETIAEVILPSQDLKAGDAAKRERSIDELAFSPWNAGGGLYPIGGLNRARRLVYPASARLRAPSPPASP